jgi:hypothetical protein
MDAMKEALKRKMQEGKGKPMGMGMPKPDLEKADGQTEGDPFDEKLMREENDLAPELEGEEPEEKQEMSQELEENDLLRQILAAISDRGNTSGRGPMGLAERAAESAKGKLAGMKKA